ncbi:DUF1269 domain-containing protein [bacterium]|nr:DUF1269 domain-containing protein [bacterium]
MTEKLVCTVPSLDSLKEAVALLRQSGLSDELISVIGPDTAVETDLPDGGLYENDVVPAAARGAVTGSATGLIAGLVAGVALPGLAVGGAAALLLLAAGGASIGALASTLVGASVPNSQIREYEEAIEKGEFLLIVELEDEQFDSVKQSLRTQIPGISIDGTVDPIPPAL